MFPARVLEFPVRDPQLFSEEVNSRMLADGEFGRLLYAAIKALPHIKDPQSQQDLRDALCDLLLRGAA